MRNKSIILAILALVLIVGATVSGCNRDKRTAMNTQRQQRSRNGQPTRQAVRPAEVLSASAYRPQPSAYRPQQAEGTASFIVQDPHVPVVMAQNVQVQPVSYPTYTTTYAEPIPAPTYTHAYSSPAPRPAPVVYTYEQATVIPTPELAMARASLPPAPQPTVYQAPVHRAPPIPELEPVRYRAPVERTANRPVAEVIMSAAPDRTEMQRALAPLGHTEPVREWVPTPVTAMRY